MGEIIGCSRKIGKKMMGVKLNPIPWRFSSKSDYLAPDNSDAGCLNHNNVINVTEVLEVSVFCVWLIIIKLCAGGDFKSESSFE